MDGIDALGMSGPKRPRVVFLTTEYPDRGDPIGGVFIREHAYAAAEFTDVAVLHVSRRPGHKGLYEVERAREEQLPTWRVRYRTFGRPLSYIAFVVGAFDAFCRARRTIGADILHANSHLSMIPALALGRIFALPVVYTEHWSIFLPDNPNELAPQASWVARAALRGATVVLPVSEAMRTALAAREPRARFHVVPNIAADAFKPDSTHRRGDPPLLITAGGLTENQSKGIDYLLRAAAELHRRGRRFRLEIAGDGPRREEYVGLAHDLGIDRLVSFDGFLSKDMLAGRFRAADLFVLASRFENNPCVVMEAMASGLPVVATRVGGIPEMVSPDAGLLVPAHDPPALAAGLERALDTLDSFDRTRIADAAQTRWGREAIARELRAVYESCLSGNAIVESPGRATPQS